MKKHVAKFLNQAIFDNFLYCFDMVDLFMKKQFFTMWRYLEKVLTSRKWGMVPETGTEIEVIQRCPACCYVEYMNWEQDHALCLECGQVHTF